MRPSPKDPTVLESELLPLDRRTWIGLTAAAIAGGVARAGEPGASRETPSAAEPPGQRGMPTRFQVACMTLPYSQVLARAGPQRHQGGRVPVRRVGHDASGRERN